MHILLKYEVIDINNVLIKINNAANNFHIIILHLCIIHKVSRQTDR